MPNKNMFFLEAVLIAQGVSGRFSLVPGLHMSQLQNFCQKLNCQIFIYLLDGIEIQKLPVSLKASS